MTLEQELLAFRKIRGSWSEEEVLISKLLPAALREPKVMATMLGALTESTRGWALCRFVRELVPAGDAADPAVPVVVKSLATTHNMRFDLAVEFFKGREDLAVPFLVESLPEAVDGGRLRVLRALHLLGADMGALATELRTALRSKDSELRSYAAGIIGPDLKDFVPDLVLLLRDEDDAVFYEAISALKRMPIAAKPALPALKDIARKSENDWRRAVAANAIELISGKD